MFDLLCDHVFQIRRFFHGSKTLPTGKGSGGGGEIGTKDLGLGHAHLQRNFAGLEEMFFFHGDPYEIIRLLVVATNLFENNAFIKLGYIEPQGSG